ncbi:hypothetical protein AS189_12275 [Arthrobacter alpinus]|uniref:MobA-like NTP transferase domain-containing protein n=1 Tax=Arthrobacter alpinus TaxID=656366 RepID=A0A0S2M0K4_9MICC|nr:nucleotidyltransferase family protein [Arthrobacter alpinus]ALO67137.1 hypothetical protein AS189_12275 [Arthrobacter alpinus]
MTRTVAVLLAAGAGTRLGLGPKALLTFRGTTLVAHAATELLRGGCSEVIVVVGAGAAQVRATPLPPGCRIVENPRWEEGMGTSFAAGIAAATDGVDYGVGEGDGAGCVLVALVDQPGMSFGLIEILLALHKPGRITAAGYRSPYGVETARVENAGVETAGVDGTANVGPAGITRAGAYVAATVGPGKLRRGNPVAFSANHARAAAALAAGDSGARTYLAAHPELVDLVDFSPYTDGADIDTPADLHFLE